MLYPADLTAAPLCRVTCWKYGECHRQCAKQVFNKLLTAARLWL